MSKKALFAAVLATTMLVPLAACGSDDKPGAGAKSTPSLTPAEVLAAAVTKTSGKSLKFTVPGISSSSSPSTSSGDGSGVYDSTTKTSSQSYTNDGETIQYIVSGDAMYAVGAKDLAGKALKFQISKFPDNSMLLMLADPLVGLTLLTGATSAQSLSAGSISGTIDLAKVTSSNAVTSRVIKYIGTEMGTKTTGMAYSATVDANGYLTKVKITYPAADGGISTEFTVNLSDFGTANTITIPSGANVIDAPAESYTAE